jgi:hypothetical protein
MGQTISFQHERGTLTTHKGISRASETVLLVIAMTNYSLITTLF